MFKLKNSFPALAQFALSSLSGLGGEVRRLRARRNSQNQTLHNLQETNLKKAHRRIEITAFRSQVTVMRHVTANGGNDRVVSTRSSS